jgi:Holliday junction DNA helicase RuvA
MIVHISGKLISKDPSSVIIDANGIGYKLHISLNTYNSLSNINEQISLLTYFNVTEKGQDLFGFDNPAEKKTFEMLISVSGIGPKIAINLLSFVKPQEFRERIISGEVKLLTSLPGIGPKTAKRLIIELKDKFINSDDEDLPIDENTDLNSDIFSALKNLGFKDNSIRLVLKNIDIELSLENKIKEALKKLR